MKFLQSVITNIKQANLDPNTTLILTTNAQSIRYLQKKIKYKISTLDTLTLAPYKAITNLELLIKLFFSCKKNNLFTDFNKFIKIGGSLLHDFDIIDRCLVNAHDIFSSIYTQKQMSTTFNELPEKQQQIIIKFWKSFKIGKLSHHQDVFLQFWNSLANLYDDFTDTLIKENTTYTGLGYKIFADNIDENIQQLQKKYENMIMIGFFPVYQSDIKILNCIKKNFHTLTFSQQDFPNNNDSNDINLNFYPLSTTSKQISLAIEKIQSCSSTKSIGVIIPHDKQILIQFISSIPKNLIISSSLNFPIELTAAYELIIMLMRIYKRQVPIENVENNLFVKKNDINLENFDVKNSTLGQYLLSILLNVTKCNDKKDAAIIKAMVQQLERIKNFTVDEKFIKSLLQNIQIPINTDTESNIHLLPLSDTSNLDFDEVIILGANDNILPSKIGETSYIPYNLRKGYGLPTSDTTQYRLEKFYFYKLIYNSEKVDIAYNTTLGNKSRFLYQLEFESKIPINYHSGKSIVHNHDKQIFLDTSYLTIDNDELKKIKIWTPSMINTYLDCPYKFFLSMMIKNEKDEYNLGLLVHKTLQTIYKKGTIVTEDFIRSIDVKHIVDKIFCNHEINSGEQLIDKDVAVLMVQKVLDLDILYTPFEIFDVEYKTQALTIEIDEEIFHFNGVIDRIDKKDNHFRVVDYKTSITKNKTKSIEELFEIEKGNRPKAVLQLLLYSLMLDQEYPNALITPHIYDLRSNLDDTNIYLDKNKILNLDAELKNIVIDNLKNFFRQFIKKNTVLINHKSVCTFCKFANFCQHNT